VAVEDVPGFLAAAGAKIQEAFPGAQPLFVGHLGDGNIHVNVLFATMPDPEHRSKLTAEVNDCVFDIVETFGGSITAEHGIGQALRDRLPGHAGPVATSLMRGVKQLFDPLNILNPGKVLPPDRPA
jgi:FAD/FMN-containing dehydrogenase